MVFLCCDSQLNYCTGEQAIYYSCLTSTEGSKGAVCARLLAAEDRHQLLANTHFMKMIAFL